ncbi:MAG: HEAT repeat domain-containing protein [Thermomicrobiales bacterium]
MVEAIAIQARTSKVAQQALYYVRRWDRYRHQELLPTLLADDPTWIRVHGVVDYLELARQDLLTPHLSAPHLTGRFDEGAARTLVGFGEGYCRWSRSQQQRFLETLTEVTDDIERHRGPTAFAIRAMAALQFVEPVRLYEIASLPHRRLRDIAIHSLGRRDDARSTALLLEALGDGRARFAVFALRGHIARMSDGDALAFVRAIPRDRVTVAKQVMRLYGGIKSEEALQDLLILNNQDLHRDVRVALLAALRVWRDREEVWPIFDEAAVDPEPAIAQSLIHIPATGLSSAHQERLVHLFAKLFNHPERWLRVKLLHRLAEQPIADPGGLLVGSLAQFFDDEEPYTVGRAASAIFGLYGEVDPEIIATHLVRVFEKWRNRQPIVELLRLAASLYAERMAAPIKAILLHLGGDPLSVTLQCHLANMALPSEDLADHFVRLAEAGDLHAEALIRSVDEIEGRRQREYIPVGFSASTHRDKFRRRFHRNVGWEQYMRSSERKIGADRFDDDGTARFEVRLANHVDPALRRLAVAALVGDATDPFGWTTERRSRLEQYRQDSAPLVASAARSVLISAEPVVESQSEA